MLRTYKRMKKLLSGSFLEHNRSHEYSSKIIEAFHTGRPIVFNINVLNTCKLILNLPEDTCVDVPIIADAN